MKTTCQVVYQDTKLIYSVDIIIYVLFCGFLFGLCVEILKQTVSAVPFYIFSNCPFFV